MEKCEVPCIASSIVAGKSLLDVLKLCRYNITSDYRLLRKVLYTFRREGAEPW